MVDVRKQETISNLLLRMNIENTNLRNVTNKMFMFLQQDDPRQDTIRNEILEYAKKKYPNVNITYADVWRFKSTLVRGLQSSI